VCWGGAPAHLSAVGEKVLSFSFLDFLLRPDTKVKEQFHQRNYNPNLLLERM
jgi:hypothetical protein